MERKLLEDLGLEKDAIDTIMAENGKDIEKAKKPVDALETERDTLKQQLADASEVLKGLEGKDIAAIEQAAEEWKQKYTDETEQLKAQLADKEYQFVVEGAASGLSFSSTAAKKAFLNDLATKKLPVENGKLMGLDDYVKAYKEADPEAFKSTEPVPRIVAGGAPAAPEKGWREKANAAYAAAKKDE